jgi:hypothetical protein
VTHDCNNFDINIKGDWGCNGIFIYDTKTVTFDGTDNQSITNIDFQTFYNLTIDKSSGTVNLNSNVVVIDELDMTQGNINTGVDKISLGTSTTDYGTLTYTSGQVIGKYEKWFVQSVHDGIAQSFPVGTDSYYRPISAIFIIGGGISSGGSIIAEFIESNPGSSGLALQDSPQIDPDSVYNTFIDGYWSLTDANGISITDYDLQLTGNGFSSFTIESETRLLIRDNYVSDWTNEGTHVNAVSYTAKRTGLLQNFVSVMILIVQGQLHLLFLEMMTYVLMTKTLNIQLQILPVQLIRGQLLVGALFQDKVQMLFMLTGDQQECLVKLKLLNGIHVLVV